MLINNLLFGMVGGAKIIATGIREINRIIVTDMLTISFFLFAEKIKNNMMFRCDGTDF